MQMCTETGRARDQGWDSHPSLTDRSEGSCPNQWGPLGPSHLTCKGPSPGPHLVLHLTPGSSVKYEQLFLWSATGQKRKSETWWLRAGRLFQFSLPLPLALGPLTQVWPRAGMGSASGHRGACRGTLVGAQSNLIGAQGHTEDSPAHLCTLWGASYSLLLDTK